MRRSKGPDGDDGNVGDPTNVPSKKVKIMNNGDEAGGVDDGPSKKVEVESNEAKPFMINSVKVKSKEDDVAGGPTDDSSKKVKDDEVDPPVDNDESPPLDEQESNEANPFLLDPVLKIMTSFMTIDDLKMSRGVCQLWDHYSCKELEGLASQRKPAMRFSNADDIQKFSSSLEDSPNKLWISNKITTTLNAFSSASDEEGFFQNFKPESLTVEKYYYNDTSVVIKMLQNSSEYVKELCIQGSFNHQWQILWPKNLKFPHLETLSFKDDGRSYSESVQFVIKNIIVNSPKLNSLKFCHHYHRFDRQLCDLLISSNVLGKLESFEIMYRYLHVNDVDECLFAQDLLNMNLAGLKLTKFAISIMYNIDSDENEVILGQLGLLKEFLKFQSDTLEHLKISIALNLNAKLNMPSLPKLKVLEIVNYETVANSNEHFYDQMDLPLIFPNLREIIIDLKFDLDDLSGIFNGSLDSVVKVRVKHPDQNSFKNYKNYRHLEAYFPHVLEFEVDQMKKHDDEFNMKLYNKEYENIPWRKSLKKLTLHPHPDKFEFLKLESLSHLKELNRLELINKMTSTLPLTKLNDFNYESLAITSVKSLKIRNFLINEDDLGEIRSRFTLDFVLDPVHAEAQINLNLTRAVNRSLPRRSSRVINQPSKS